MKYRSTIFFILIFLVIFIISRCAPQPCSQVTDAMIKASFYKTGSDSIRTADSVTIYAIGDDTNKVYDKATSLSTISIPLDSGTDSCSYFFKFNLLADTVTFYYTNYPTLISKECGYTYYHSLDSIKHKKTVLDYIIVNRKITTVNGENIRIFY
ncbi:MAG: DUF6452 family protein [Bacteroidales bacterium]